MQQKRSNWSQWIGVAIFLMFAVGGRFLPPLANWFAQVTGLPVSVPTLVVAILVFAAAVGGLQTMFTRMMRTGQSNETRLPTSPAESSLPPIFPQPDLGPDRLPRPGLPPRSTPPRSTPPFPGPSVSSRPSAQPPLGGPPKFEPIINPRVLAFGVAGLLVFGVVFLILFLMPL